VKIDLVGLKKIEVDPQDIESVHEQHVGPQQLLTTRAGLRALTNALMIRPSISSCSRISA
jgi:hypothetical protein